jgi:hypothetical protein
VRRENVAVMTVAVMTVPSVDHEAPLHWCLSEDRGPLSTVSSP